MFFPYPIFYPTCLSDKTVHEDFDQRAAEITANFDAKMDRITALHQQADTEHWHGQIFKRLEAE